MQLSIVGIGASAGGLEAFRLLIAHVPANTGLAFVFVQHLDPKHHSNLTEILAGVSAIPVRQAADGMKVEPNVLYVIPPDAGLEIMNQVLRITPRAPVHSGPHMPIDRFLRSLAQECGSRAIGVILSGAGTDGAAGVEAVKAAEGVTFAQDPTTAKFDSMPQAAIGTGCVDFVLSPAAIAAELTTLAHHPYIAENEDAGPPGWTADLNEQFDPIFAVLREATGVDFALYRQTTVRRRILRRLALLNIGSMEEYRERIENDARELSTLHQDLLINVTHFFRDPESFESLKKLVFPRLVRDRRPDTAIRIWVPGCSTGEEAYSIAISLQEYFWETGHAYPVQIFASDISERSVNKARSGRYAETISADVSPERLNRHFSKIEQEYQISKALREMCVFSKHDLIQDPPFSKMDAISCRNVLIYFGIVRENVVALFHYALNPGGFLVLGPSEAELGKPFSIVEGTPGIYVKSQTAGGTPRPLYTSSAGSGRSANPHMRTTESPAGVLATGIDVPKELALTLLSRYKSAAVVVDRTLQVLEILGEATPYLTLLTPSAGKAGLNLLRLIPEIRLFLEVEKLVREVERRGESARRSRVPCGDAGEVDVEVIHLGAAPRTGAFLVLFGPSRGLLDIELAANSDHRDRENARLKQDLADARQRFLDVIEEQHSVGQASRQTVDDTPSANEELRSLNEELETTKEELQSTNEELATLNQELLSKNAELTEARDSARLIIEIAAAPLLVLDEQMWVKTANASFYQKFGLSPREAEGQLFYSLSNGCWDIPRVREVLDRILPDQKVVEGIEIEQDFPGIGHRVLVLNARQLTGLQQILLGIEDVTERKERAEATLHESEGRFRTMADTAPVMIWVAGPDKGCTFFNAGWLAFTGRTMQQELGDGWAQNVHPDDLAGCLDTYSSSFDARRSFQMEYRVRRADGEYRWLLDNGAPRFEADGIFAGYIGSCIDITDLKRTHEEHLAKQKLETVGTLAGGIAHDFNNILGGVLANSELALAELAGGANPADELERIRHAAVRGSEIVRQLMIYAGEESEVVELVSVSGMVEDMLELLKVSISKLVTIETDLDEHLPAIKASPSQIRQVVMNLITNASEAIGDREGVIRVTTGRVTVSGDSLLAASQRMATGDYVRLEVSDTGRGMTPELQARIFDPLFTTKTGGSHGLGLAVIQRIVQHLQGTILVSSAPGKGTTFQVLLPCGQHMVEATDSAIARSKDETLTSLTATILVVEDEDTIRQAVSIMLRKEGLSVLEASNGSLALELIRAQKEHIDVLLLDIGLPGASGREVYEEAARLRPRLPVIVTTAKTEEMAAALLATRVEHFLRKPFRLGDLIDMVRRILSL
jgi:two-component system CheB/CheR fusion protein